jgi:succinate dehydrogenase / fumarate reductase cytochrome b subunit
MAQTPSKARPLSPHLQVYRPQITSVLSILHRITGVGLGLGAIWLVTWLYLAAKGTPAFDTLRAFNSSWLGVLLLIGFAFALYYHLCNGIRHLVWDAGWGYDLKTVTISGWVVVGASIVLTVLSVIAGIMIAGVR